MIDLFKRILFTGLGAAALTKEKIDEIAGEFVAKGKLSQQEGEKLVDELQARSEQAKEELKQQVEAKVGEILGRMNLARMSDLEELRKEIATLRAQVEKPQAG